MLTLMYYFRFCGIVWPSHNRDPRGGKNPVPSPLFSVSPSLLSHLRSPLYTHTALLFSQLSVITVISQSFLYVAYLTACYIVLVNWKHDILDIFSNTRTITVREVHSLKICPKKEKLEQSLVCLHCYSLRFLHSIPFLWKSILTS